MKLNGLDLNKLHTFCAVVDHKGYRGASERIGLSRSAISQTITALESQLGQILFHRTGTKLIPTQAAFDFHRDILVHYQGIEGAIDRLQGRTETTAGLIRVGAYLEFTKGKLMPAIENFLLANPRAQIQFHFDSPSRLEQLLERGKIDLSVSIYPHRKQGIKSEELHAEELCLIGGKTIASKRAGASELAELPVIDYFPSHVLFKRWWGVHFRKGFPKVAIRSFAATAEMVLEMVERNLGIGVVPKYLLKNASDRIHVIEPTSKKLVDHLWVSRKPEKNPNLLTTSFLAAIRRTL